MDVGRDVSDFMDGLVPIASQPSAMSGRNWITRRVRIEAIRNDPGLERRQLREESTRYVYTLPLASLMTESVVRIQETRLHAKPLTSSISGSWMKRRRTTPTTSFTRSRRSWTTTRRKI